MNENKLDKLHVDNLTVGALNYGSSYSPLTIDGCPVDEYVRMQIDLEIKQQFEQFKSKYYTYQAKQNQKFNQLLDFLIVKGVLNNKEEFDEYLEGLKTANKLSESK